MRKLKRITSANLRNTTKSIVWFCIINGVAWVWCSYLLAYLGREEIAESLSEKAVAQIIGVALLYCLKALLEKKPEFGSVGKTGNEYNYRNTDDSDREEDQLRDL